MLKRLYFRLLAALGADARLARRAGRRGLAVVLNLHRVSPHPDPFFPPLHPRLFEELLAFLARHFRVSALADLAAEPGRPAAALSFDDGYHDFLEYALPALDRRRLPVNLNLCPAYLEGATSWEVELTALLRAAPRRLLDEVRVPGFAARARGDDYLAKARYGLALMGHLKALPRPARAAAWAEVRAALGRAGPGAPVRMMTVADARQLAHLPEVGAHSYTHELMGDESVAFLVDDFRRCRRFFRERLGRAVDIYAFPSGSYRPAQADALRAEGVRFVLTSGERHAAPGAGVVDRFTFYGDTPAEVRVRAAGYRPRRWAARLVATAGLVAGRPWLGPAVLTGTAAGPAPAGPRAGPAAPGPGAADTEEIPAFPTAGGTEAPPPLPPPAPAARET